MKVCTRCGIEKPIENFCINKKCAGGRSTICKVCVSERDRNVYFPPQMDGVIKCTTCGEIKPALEFRPFPRNRTGRTYHCKTCETAYRHRHHEKPRGRASRLVTAARARAKTYGIPFNVTVDYVADKIAKGVCQVTGIPFTLDKAHRGAKHSSPFAPSIDRIDPEKGYTEDNVRIVVWIYNAAKCDFTDDDVLVMARSLCERRAAA